MNEHEFERIGRVLALCVRARWVAHALFDSSAQLLDFGASRFASPRSAKARFLFLVEVLYPTTVVFRRMSPQSGRDRPKTRRLAHSMRRACHQLSLQVALLSREDVRNCFKMRGAKTKHEIASVLAQEFPVLAWKLPPRRRNYDHEHWNMPIFDAVALGLAYFSHSTEETLQLINE
jgi:hypothetical protein